MKLSTRYRILGSVAAISGFAYIALTIGASFPWYIVNLVCILIFSAISGLFFGFSEKVKRLEEKPKVNEQGNV